MGAVKAVVKHLFSPWPYAGSGQRVFLLAPQSNNIIDLCVIPALRDGRIVRIIRRDGSLGHEVYVMQGEGVVRGDDNDEVYAVVSEDDSILSNDAALVSMARSIYRPAVQSTS